MVNCLAVSAAFVKNSPRIWASCRRWSTSGTTLDLPPARYRILMKGVEIGSGDAYPGRWLAINPGTAAGTLPGEQTTDLAFGLAAIWIESALKEQAQIRGLHGC